MRVLLRAIVIAGLAIDAYLHFKLAPDMDFREGELVDMGWLFRAQAVVAAGTALLVLVRANRTTFALAFLVAGSAVGALLLYHYVDVGPIGPLPDMYDPVWYTEKVITAVAEGLATAAALVGVLWRPSRTDFGPGEGEGEGESAGSARSRDR